MRKIALFSVQNIKHAIENINTSIGTDEEYIKQTFIFNFDDIQAILNKLQSETIFPYFSDMEQDELSKINIGFTKMKHQNIVSTKVIQNFIAKQTSHSKEISKRIINLEDDENELLLTLQGYGRNYQTPETNDLRKQIQLLRETIKDIKCTIPFQKAYSDEKQNTLKLFSNTLEIFSTNTTNLFLAIEENTK